MLADGSRCHTYARPNDERGNAVSEDAEDALSTDDEAATSQAVTYLAETARQLKEMADYLHELARRPIEDGRTLH